MKPLIDHPQANISESYLQKRHMLNLLLRNSKESYYKTKLANAKNKLKELWVITKKN